MEKVFIAGSSRTPVGIYDGKLKSLREQTLGMLAAKDVMQKTSIEAGCIDEVVIGIAKQTSSPSNCARYIGLEADIPESVPAYTVQRQGASGLQAVLNGYYKIKAGNANVILAGGTESMTQIPYEIHNARFSFTSETRIIFDPIPAQIAGSQPQNKYGRVTLEGINAKIAEGRGYTDQAQRDYVQASLAKKRASALDEALVNISVKVKKAVETIAEDELYESPGLTAGYADAAAISLLINEAAAEKHNIRPWAEIVSVGVSAGDPAGDGMVGEAAMLKALKKAGKSASDMDLIEINEITAAQSMAAIDALGFSEDQAAGKVNVYGGALATGNPWAASGTVALHRLLYGLKAQGKEWGLLVCGAEGGQAIAAVLKMCL